MSRFRLSRPAEIDLTLQLAMSADRWGEEGRRRYSSILAAAMQRVAADPQGRNTRDRADLLAGLRSFHIRHAGRSDPEAKVRRPVHILYYRVVEPGLIEVLRILDERMEPSRHLSGEARVSTE
jgi:toxin ParE1/3/4